MLPVELSEASVQIIVHQRDGEVGRTHHHANVEGTQRVLELTYRRNVDRLDAHASFSQFALGLVRCKPEARAIGRRDGRLRGTRPHDDIAPSNEPLERFLNLVGRKMLLQLARECAQATAASPYRGSDRAIEL